MYRKAKIPLLRMYHKADPPLLRMNVQSVVLFLVLECRACLFNPLPSNLNAVTILFWSNLNTIELFISTYYYELDSLSL
jgi:hypothetical protein